MTACAFVRWRVQRLGFRWYRWEVLQGTTPSPASLKSATGVIVAHGYAKSERAAKRAALAAYDEVQL